MERYARRSLEVLQKAFQAAGLPAAGLALPKIEELELPPDPALGDLGFPCFKLAKPLRKAPPAVAQELAVHCQAALMGDADKTMLRVAAVGPYVNFTVDPEVAVREILADILKGEHDGSYGHVPEKTRGRWVIEFSSPNIAKPFMAGHLRSTALGAALARVGSFRGFDVVSINHLGDWGTQYGKLAVAMQRYGSELPDHPTIQDLVGVYVMFHEEAEKNPDLEDEARDAFARLERGDPELIELWKKCVVISMHEFSRTYQRLGVEFTHMWGESYYKDLLEPLLQDLKKRGLVEESEGALVVRVTDDQGKEIPPAILQKKDGATIYATRDVAAAVYRWDKFHFDRMSYVVGSEQKLHFQQLFAVLKRMGCEWAPRCEHIPYGLYRFKGGKMSTRKGNFVTLNEVLETAREAVLEKIRARQAAKDTEGSPVSDLPDAAETAEAVALGAVVFNDLSNDPIRDLDFDVDRITDFEGETGPYLQYAHTRCKSILRKAGTHPDWARDGALTTLLKAPEELLLLKVLGRFPHHLERTLSFSKASQLCHYLIDVTKAFGAFYRECRVIDETKPELTRARLLLVEATRRILGLGLGFLGIPRPERM
ncbi:MAG TPA: arginine--tRNA ligase [Bdellovibrionota bacterium]|jgi:arginyl-tRNA synthetase|nr:arginine--tRNA ligase [Bdellovibrionota bacterium]